MGGLKNITYIDYDVMHPVSQVPVHLAHINNTCVTPDTSCTLEMNTVTENIYPSTINSDNPSFPLAAVEVIEGAFLFYLLTFLLTSITTYFVTHSLLPSQ